MANFFVADQAGTMRELNAWARRSQGREVWREFYAGYIKSPEWFARRVRWFEEEIELSGTASITCLGGCGRKWKLSQGDLHHCSYDRLGNEAHEDLWPLCRACHDDVHYLLDSTRSWRKLDRQLANQQALRILQARYVPVDPRSGAVALRSYL